MATPPYVCRGRDGQKHITSRAHFLSQEATTNHNGKQRGVIKNNSGRTDDNKLSVNGAPALI